MKINQAPPIFMRTMVFGGILLGTIMTFDYFMGKFSYEEKKTQVVLDHLRSDEILASELYRLFYGLEDDFSFFEKKLIRHVSQTRSEESTGTLIDFLNTHPHYLKVRMTNQKGREIFKIVQRPDRVSFEESRALFDLSPQEFFKELNQVSENEFFFSSMEANVINGVIERPVRPVIRVSKRIRLSDGRDGLLIFNIDGKRILQIFERESRTSQVEQKALVDHRGFYIASYPLLSDVKYTLEKEQLPQNTLNKLSRQEVQGSVDINESTVVFTQLPLPRSSEKWYLISTIPESTVKAGIQKERLTRLFWEILGFTLILFWFWRDEKKRHREQVVQVLLKERSEFIQNVSHQLKTPLTIMLNDLNQDLQSQEFKEELRTEIVHLIKVVEDLLLLSQIETLNNIPLVKENILEIINDTIDMVAKKAKEKNITIRLNLKEPLMESLELLEKEILPDLLKSAIFNLLDNAIDHSPDTSAIEIAISAGAGKILVRIKDDGTGIPKAMIPHLFERFNRTGSSKRKGTGLGLAISKKILELHKGGIRHVPTDKGALFEFWL
jgi:nitrogen-specific signal transduction histidine kinase